MDQPSTELKAPTDQEKSVESLEKLLKAKIAELEEAQKNVTKLESECLKLRKYNKDLISQIDLTNSKLHVLLGVCEGRSEKQTQTDISIKIDDIVGEEKCQLDDSSFPVEGTNQETKLKAADWARIAQEVVDSNDYIYEPTSKTYYSQSTGWYYYPNEKLFFDPKSEKYYRYNHETKSHEPYPSEPCKKSESSTTEDGKDIKTIKVEQESEEGEIGSSSSESSSPRDMLSEGEDDDVNSQMNEDGDGGFDDSVESSISCLRMIVRESHSLDLGSLLLITCKGALIGSSDECDVIITDPSVSRKHARFSFDRKKRHYQVVDCSSRYGVFINGKKLEKDEPNDVKHGDIVKFGLSEFLLHHHNGKDVTCIHCEPGCVQAELGLQARLNKEEDNGFVIEDRQSILNKLKKRYGVTWEDQNKVSLPESYQDRAKKRRIEKGSDNPYEKTGEGTSLDKPLNQKNKGFKLLEKLGWSKGKGIGKDMSGDTKPLPLLSVEGRAGLGFHS